MVKKGLYAIELNATFFSFAGWLAWCGLVKWKLRIWLQFTLSGFFITDQLISPAKRCDSFVHFLDFCVDWLLLKDSTLLSNFEYRKAAHKRNWIFVLSITLSQQHFGFGTRPLAYVAYKCHIYSFSGWIGSVSVEIITWHNVFLVLYTPRLIIFLKVIGLGTLSPVINQLKLDIAWREMLSSCHK